MRIGIDISQLAYPKTGVATYLFHLVKKMIEQDKENTYILFYSSLRRKLPVQFQNKNVEIKKFKLPPTVLDFLWNTLHIVPVEAFIGSVDVFISSDWTQPPSKAKKATIIYDMIVYTYPEETAGKIVRVQKKRLEWVKKEVDKIFCISEATRKDVEKILGIEEKRLKVVYPGVV